MSNLDRLHNEVHGLLKGTLEINPGLESVFRHKKFKKAVKRLDNTMRSQVRDLITDELFENIKGRIGKAEDIWTESDDLEIFDAVAERIKKLDEDEDTVLFMVAFLLWTYNMGGQDFLNKHNLPKEFNLTNRDIIRQIETQTVTVLRGVDKTTTDWVVDQIKTGRQEGKPYEYIADNIREQIPETYEGRADRIVRTEASRMVGQSEHETASRNGATHKHWVTVGGACPICVENEAAGTIGIQEPFPSFDYMEPAHPNCRCIVEYVFTPFMGTIWSGE